MYNIIYRIIDHNYTTGDSGQQYIYYTCCVLIIVWSAVFIDMIYQIFSRFWNGRK